MTETPNQRTILRYFIALLLMFLLLMGQLLLPFASILVLSFVITAVLYPVYQRLSRLMPPVAAALLICMSLFFTVLTSGGIFVGILSKEVLDLYQVVKGAVLGDTLREMILSSNALETLNRFLGRFSLSVAPEDLVRPFTDLGKVVGVTLVDQVRTLASNALKVVISFLMMMLVVFFLLKDGRTLLDFLVDLSPLPKDQDEKLIEKFKVMAGAILVVNGIGGFLQGVCGGILFSICGFRSPVLWGVVMGILAFLPIVGIGVILLPAALYLLFTGSFWAAMGVVLFYTVVSLGTEYLLKPKLVGDRVAMHPLLVFLSILGGLRLFGILGIIYGPLVVTGFLTLVDIYHASYQKMVEPVEH